MKKIDKKTWISCALLFLAFSLIYSGHLINNYKKYEDLNSKMEEVNIKPYEDNNFLVRNKTLKDMEKKVIKAVEDFKSWYEKEIKLSEENKKKLDDVLKSKDSNNEKFNNIKIIFKEDLKSKNDNTKKEIEKLFEKKISFNEKEEKKLESFKEDFSNVKYNDDIINILSSYKKLKEIKKDTNKNISSAEKRIKEEKEEASEKEKFSQSGYSHGSTLANDGNFNRALAMDMFNSINAYRASIGKAPYVYNSAKQSCIDSEALAYANTQNPHNWVCDNLNENASTAAVGSDLVTLSMNFFINDAPHEEVLAGRRYNYTSCAISVVERNGTYYANVGVWL